MKNKLKIIGILHNGVSISLGNLESDQSNCSAETVFEAGSKFMDQLGQFKLKDKAYIINGFDITQVSGLTARKLVLFDPNDFALITLEPFSE